MFLHSRSSPENPTRFQTKIQNGQSVYPYSDQDGAKTLPDGAAHTYMVYIREYHPPGCPWDMIESFSRDIMQFF